jgi:exosome complex component RRP42
MISFDSIPKITKERIIQYLEEEKRFDGRKPEEFREIEIETGISKKSEGSARVKIGDTEVIVGVKMDIGTPYPDSPDKGNLMVGAELTPLSSPRFEAGPPRFSAIEIARVIDRGLRESKFIDFEKLCIKEGEKVWTVFVDIYTINDDGNILDAAGIGAIAALKNARMPKYDEEKEQVLYGEFTNKNLPLSGNIPIPITVYKIKDKLIVDPTKEEEDSADTRVTIGSSNGIISSMQKGNSNVLKINEMNDVLDFSEKVWKNIFKKIEKFLK